MKYPEIKIRDRLIGINYSPLVIAEIGINHGGCLSTAFKMVDAAIESGAEVIKHQTHIIEDEMSFHAKNIIPGNANISIYEIIKKCALGEVEEIRLKNYVEAKGGIFISTPFSKKAANRLENMKVPAYKIGSGECNNYPLVEHIAKFGKPVILSTGMNDISSVGRSVSILQKYNVPYCLLHCTNVYPTPDHLIRLGGIEQLAHAFPEAVVGLSDHSIDNLSCLAAVALGASILERHFTDHKQRKGPDIACSMDKNECKELIKQSARIQKMRGGKKGIVPEENVTINFAYASVVSINKIKAGDVLTKENIWVKRPGTGDFLATDYHELLGKKVNIDIEEDVHIKKEFICG